MPAPYKDRLIAIRGMLDDPSIEVVREGYDLLFSLWLESADFAEIFDKEIIPLAMEHKEVLCELRNRLLGRSIQKDSITDTFLNKRLATLDLGISKQSSNHESEKLAGKGQETNTKPAKPPDNQSTSHSWWKKLLIGIVIIIGIIGTSFYAWWDKPLLITIMVMIALFGIINLIYILPRKSRTIPKELINLNLNYKSPIYLSLHDENTIEISVENPVQTTFKGIITLVFDDPDSSIDPVTDQKFSVEFDTSYQEKESRRYKFLLTSRPSRNSLNYHFQISYPDGTKEVTDKDKFLIAPIPYLRTASKWLFGTLGTLIVALLWEQFEKLLGFK